MCDTSEVVELGLLCSKDRAFHYPSISPIYEAFNSSNFVISSGEKRDMFPRVVSLRSLSFTTTSALSTGKLVNKDEISYDLNSSSGGTRTPYVSCW